MKNEKCIYKEEKTKQCCLIEFIKSLLSMKKNVKMSQDSIQKKKVWKVFSHFFKLNRVFILAIESQIHTLIDEA